MPTEEFEPFDNKPNRKRPEEVTLNFADLRKLYHAKVDDLSVTNVKQLQAVALFNSQFVDSLLNYIRDYDANLYNKTLDFTLTFLMQELKISHVTITMHDGTLKTFTNTPDPKLLSNIKRLEDIL